LHCICRTTFSYPATYQLRTCYRFTSFRCYLQANDPQGTQARVFWSKLVRSLEIAMEASNPWAHQSPYLSSHPFCSSLCPVTFLLLIVVMSHIVCCSGPFGAIFRRQAVRCSSHMPSRARRGQYMLQLPIRRSLLLSSPCSKSKANLETSRFWDGLLPVKSVSCAFNGYINQQSCSQRAYRLHWQWLPFSRRCQQPLKALGASQGAERSPHQDTQRAI
jgi:hypothetical protein